MKVLVQLGWFFKQQKKQYIFGIAMLVFVSLLQLLPPKIIGIIVDDITVGDIDSCWAYKMAHHLRQLLGSSCILHVIIGV